MKNQRIKKLLAIGVSATMIMGVSGLVYADETEQIDPDEVPEILECESDCCSELSEETETVRQEGETDSGEDNAEVEIEEVIAFDSANSGISIAIDENNFPDSAFRNYVLEEIDRDDDELLSEHEINLVNYINVHYMRISSLQGIEFFPNLNILYCQDNQLDSIDISQNTALVELYCYNNNLSSLDVSNNPRLRELCCYSNSLTSLDVSHNSNLQELSCFDNQISNLDVSYNPDLYRLSCGGNCMGVLNISNTPYLIKVYEEGTLQSYGSNDYSGYFDDRYCMLGFDYNVGIITDPNLVIDGVVINGESFPDKNFRQYVFDNIDVDHNGYLSNDERNSVTEIDLSLSDQYLRGLWSHPASSDEVVSCMTGIELFPELASLNIAGNRVSSINLSNNTNLRSFCCSGNYLSELDVSHNLELTNLVCDQNYLTELDLSSNTKLQRLICSGVSYNENIPWGNYLTELNLSNNSDLTYLDCRENCLTELNLDNNTLLEKLYCDHNQLTNLCIDCNEYINQLSCAGNSISQINISHNPDLICAYTGSRNSYVTATNENIIEYLYRSGDVYKYMYLDANTIINLQNAPANVGWIENEGNRYYILSDGSVATGLQIIEGKLYFFEDDGVMVESEWKTVDGGVYYFLPNSGTAAIGTVTIDGLVYVFNDVGALIDGPTPATINEVSMYRLYNTNSGEHFYTSSETERDMLVRVGWSYEGIGWLAPATSNTPVYRLYNEIGGEHHYTTSVDERDFLVSIGWNDEGIGWYSDDNQSVPLYRQYNPNAFANNHNYTTSLEENDWLVTVGWQAEGVGWYGLG